MSVLIIATIAQVLFITGLAEVHPLFLLVIIGVIGYPTALVAQEFDKNIFPQMKDKDDTIEGTVLVYIGVL